MLTSSCVWRALSLPGACLPTAALLFVDDDFVDDRVKDMHQYTSTAQLVVSRLQCIAIASNLDQGSSDSQQIPQRRVETPQLMTKDAKNRIETKDHTYVRTEILAEYILQASVRRHSTRPIDIDCPRRPIDFDDSCTTTPHRYLRMSVAWYAEYKLFTWTTNRKVNDEASIFLSHKRNFSIYNYFIEQHKFNQYKIAIRATKALNLTKMKELNKCTISNNSRNAQFWMSTRIAIPTRVSRILKLIHSSWKQQLSKAYVSIFVTPPSRELWTRR